MTAARYPAEGALVIEQGATFSRQLVIEQPAGTPVDLTGCEVRMQIRRSLRSTTPYVSLVSGAAAGETGIHVDSAVDGQFTITITSDDTASYTWKSGVYDLEVEFAGGVVKRYLYCDRVTLSREVTRP